MHWAHIIEYLFLMVITVAGVLLTILTLPGLWLIVLAAGLYVWATHGLYAAWGSLITLLLLATVAEVVELMAGSAGAKQAGASRLGMFGAVVGALLGGIFLTFLVPVPIVGTIVGVCVGAGLGAGLTELVLQRDVVHSARVTIGAAKGRFLGLAAKLAFGVVMFGVTVVTCFPWAKSAPKPVPAIAPSAAPVLPATSPATPQSVIATQPGM